MSIVADLAQAAVAYGRVSQGNRKKLIELSRNTFLEKLSEVEAVLEEARAIVASTGDELLLLRYVNGGGSPDAARLRLFHLIQKLNGVEASPSLSPEDEEC